MKLIIETGPPGDHEPEVIEVAEGSLVVIGSSIQPRDINVIDTAAGAVVYRMDADDWTELRLVQDDDL